MYTTNMNKGITLIETVTYLALFSFLMTAMLPWFFDTNLWRSRVEKNAVAVSDHLYVEGVLADLARNSLEVKEEDLGTNFDFVNFDLNDEGNLNVLAFEIFAHDQNFGTTSYPTTYE